MIILDLPAEVLYITFKYLTNKDLCNLCQTCKSFYYLINCSELWSFHPCFPTFGYGGGPFYERSYHKVLSKKLAVEVQENWRKSRFREKRIASVPLGILPSILLTNQLLWVTIHNHIVGYKRKSDGLVSFRPDVNFMSHTDDVYCMRVYNKGILSCGGDRSIVYQSLENGVVKVMRCHNRDINSIDINRNLIISGSDDGIVKAWRLKKIKIKQCGSFLNAKDKVITVRFNDSGSKCIIGSSGINEPPIYLLDSQRFSIEKIFGRTLRSGSGIREVIWLSDHTFLTCGYDKNVRKWDKRVEDQVANWEDPFDATIFSMDSDLKYGVITGTQTGCIKLYDMRSSKSVQVYFLKGAHIGSEYCPIYALKCESKCIYAGTNKSYHVMNFFR